MKRQSLSKSLRFDIFNRDAFTCQYCGRLPPTVMLQVDHIIAVSKGGTNDRENLVTSCAECNGGKKAKSIGSACNPLDEARRAQESLEATATAKLFSKAAKARKSMRQDITNTLCDILGKPTVEKRTVTQMENAVYRVGIDQFFRWITYSAMRVRNTGFLNERSLCQYFSACIRNHIEESGGSQS